MKVVFNDGTQGDIPEYDNEKLTILGKYSKRD